MKRIILLTAAVCMLLSLAAGCGVNTSGLAGITYPESIAADDYEAQSALRKQNTLSDSTIAGITDFCAQSCAQILADTGDNACYSPLSLYMALSLLTTGTDGDTKDELLNLLNVQDTDSLLEQMGNLYRRLYKDNDQAKLYMTNSLWINGDYEINQPFLDNAANNFYAAANTLDFNDNASADVISSWISDNTAGLLKPEFDIDPLDLMYIINTVYLKDEWRDNFEESATQEDEFTLADGSKAGAQFMHGTFDTGYINGDGYTAAELYLKNTGKVIFVLPDEGIDVGVLMRSPEKLADLFSFQNSEYGAVEMSLPKFSFERELGLIENLKALGMQSVFDPNSANLTGITDLDLAYVSNVVQGTSITVNENGLEAAAYTKIDIALKAAPMAQDNVVINLNRPFIFIVQSDDGIPIFIGAVQNPNS